MAANEQTLEDLQRFAIPDVVRIQPGHGNLPEIVVTNQFAEAKLYLAGAHVTHYHPRGQAPVLWMSGSSMFEAGKPIRGGIPICWPWFGPHKTNSALPGHGFARLKTWALRGVTQQKDGQTRIALGLVSDAETLKVWAHPFELEYVVLVGRKLDAALQVKNTGAAPFTFDEALHTYLAIGDIHSVSVQGLTGAAFADRMQNGQRCVQDKPPLTFRGETDRIYLNTPAACEVLDPGLKRTLLIEKQGSQATVVWNPWIAKSKAMKDFGDDEWPGMLCIETANAADCAVTLPAGKTHAMHAIVSVK